MPIISSALRTAISTSRQLRYLRPLTTTSFQFVQPQPESDVEPQTPQISPTAPLPRSRPSKSQTPLELQFESSIQTLKSGFTPSDVNFVLRSQTDPDLAMDIFRWTALRRPYKHDHSTYLTMLQIAVAGNRPRYAETLLEEVLAGACPLNLQLYNSLIRFCCSKRFLFRRAFDVYKKMLASDTSKPDLDTYSMLFNILLRRFDKIHVSHVYLHAVRSLTKQMKSVGVIPDSFVLNLMIKAYSKCLELDGAIRVFREMGLYGCEPNAYSYSYIIKGLCEKSRVVQGLRFYKEMKEKGLVPSSSTFMVLICGLAMVRRFDESVEVVFDMISVGMSPDYLTYKTLMEEICRDGKGDHGFELLEEFRKKDVSMGERTYKCLLDELRFLSRDWMN